MNIRKLGLTSTIAILSVTSVLGGCSNPQESIRSKAEEVNKIKAELDKVRKEATEDKAAFDKVRKEALSAKNKHDKAKAKAGLLFMQLGMTSDKYGPVAEETLQAQDELNKTTTEINAADEALDKALRLL